MDDAYYDLELEEEDRKNKNKIKFIKTIGKVKHSLSTAIPKTYSHEIAMKIANQKDGC